MCDCAFGSIESSPTGERRAHRFSSLWKFAALRQSLRAALRGSRGQRALAGSLASRSRA